MLDLRYGRTGRSLCGQAKLIMALHRLLRRLGKIHLIFIMGAFLFVLYAVKQVQNSRALEEDEGEFHMYRQLHANYNYDAADLVYYKKEVPLIWIGGVPRSGTTLMRAMLDAHPDIRCGEETRVIPRILGMHLGMVRAELEMNRLREAKITDDILDSALGAYILSIIAKHGEPAPRLCNKDPFTLRSMQRLLRIFPNSKFILMVRDGRAVVHSIISRKVTIKGFDIHSYRGAIRDWNRAVSTMYSECLTVGRDRCLALYYEQLVLHPKDQLRRVLRFLEVPWNDIVLHHEKTIGQTGGVSLSRRELSTDQVNKPVNTGALSKWVEHIPADVRKDMRQLAPMLETLGYDPDGYPPNYGTPDKIVARQSAALDLSRKDDSQRNR